MHKKNLTLLLAVFIGLLAYDSSAQTATETVNVVQPGTLRDLINELSAPRIKNLTINGSLNGKDIAYLVGGSGKMVSVDTLDISKITLVGDDEPYKQLLVETSDVGFGTTTEIYYLSERDTIIYDGQSTGLGGYKGIHHVFCKDLSGAFGENSSFKRILMPENLSKVGNYQFFRNTSVCSVELPQNATKFGERAFDGAGALKALRIPDGIVTIPQRSVRCSSLETVELPTSVDSIYNQAFEGSPIKLIDLKNVRYVGKSAFSGNRFTGILDISSLEYIGPYAFNGSNEIENIIFSSRITDIPQWAFSGAGITSLELPSNIESIGEGAFRNCQNLQNVILPSNLINISVDSFQGTPWQENLKGDNGVIYVGTIALSFDYSTYDYYSHMPPNGTFSFREGTTAIANNCDGNGWGFFPVHTDNWHLEKVHLPESLVRIGNRVFKGCKDLTGINIPEGVLEIGHSAFSGCEVLESINLPKGITEISDNTFYDCKELQEIVFPDNIKKIGKSAFENASKMYFWELPNSLKVIESGAFTSCKSIPSVTLPENLDSIHTGAFFNCTGIETIRINSKNLKSASEIFQKSNSIVINNENNLNQVIISPETSVLPEYMFYQCKALEKVKFESINTSVLGKIENFCFAGCPQLSLNELPASLDSIGWGAFSGTLGYKGILDTNNVSYIGMGAFQGMKGITDLIISSPHLTIGSGAFSDCPSLKNVTLLSESIEREINECYGYQSPFQKNYLNKIVLGSRLKSIPNSFFSYISTDSLIFLDRGVIEKAESLEIGSGAFESCWLSGTLKLPEGTVSIGERAFYKNNLFEVTVPSSCKEIGKSAFNSNEYLYDISLGDGVERIGERAFGACKNINSLVIPATCREIGDEFLIGCTALQSLYFLSETPPIFKGGIGRYISPTIYVPYNLSFPIKSTQK